MREKHSNLYRSLIQHPTFAMRESEYVRWYPKSLSLPPSLETLRRESSFPSGAYIHVPFCDRICRFCPFNKRPLDSELLAQFIVSLVKEIKIYGEFVGKKGLEYVYFGGGTPSVLSPTDVGRIVQSLDENIGFYGQPEITLESHPTHLSPEFFQEMKDAGINRFSSGFQAFDDRMLTAIGAQHCAESVWSALKSAQETDSVLAADLLFRCEGQTVTEWRNQLLTLVKEGIPHASLYSLILKNSDAQPNTHIEAEMTLAIDEILAEAGLRHYASCASGGFDYARPGFECRYEMNHWRAPQDQFLGLGPGALGFLGNRTTVNGLGLQAYCERLAVGKLPLVSSTPAGEEEMKRRFFILGIKTLAVDLSSYRVQFDDEPTETFIQEFAQLEEWGFARITRDLLELTALGRLNCDLISSVFFSDQEREVPHPEEPEIRRMEVYYGDLHR